MLRASVVEIARIDLSLIRLVIEQSIEKKQIQHQHEVIAVRGRSDLVSLNGLNRSVGEVNVHEPRYGKSYVISPKLGSSTSMPVIAHYVKELGTVNRVSILNIFARAVIGERKVGRVFKQIAKDKWHVNIRGFHVGIEQAQTNGGDLCRDSRECRQLTGVVSHHDEWENPAQGWDPPESCEGSGKSSEKVSEPVNGRHIRTTMTVAPLLFCDACLGAALLLAPEVDGPFDEALLPAAKIAREESALAGKSKDRGCRSLLGVELIVTDLAIRTLCRHIRVVRWLKQLPRLHRIVQQRLLQTSIQIPKYW